MKKVKRMTQSFLQFHPHMKSAEQNALVFICRSMMMSWSNQLSKFWFLEFSFTTRLLFCDLRIFGHEGEKAHDIIYVNWLSLLLNGSTRAMEFYNPKTQSWMQVC